MIILYLLYLIVAFNFFEVGCFVFSKNYSTLSSPFWFPSSKVNFRPTFRFHSLDSTFSISGRSFQTQISTPYIGIEWIIVSKSFPAMLNFCSFLQTPDWSFPLLGLIRFISYMFSFQIRWCEHIPWIIDFIIIIIKYVYCVWVIWFT